MRVFQSILLYVGTLIPMLLLIRQGQTAALPCDHPLRISAPQYFSHCDSVCTYSDWSEWLAVPKSVHVVPSSQCPTKEAYQEIRKRGVLGKSIADCTETSETRSICLPDQEDRLILALGLGGSKQDFSPIGSPGPAGPQGQPAVQLVYKVNRGRLGPSGPVGQPGQPGAKPPSGPPPTLPPRIPGVHGPGLRCPHNNGIGQICSHLTKKRSVSLRDEFMEAEGISLQETEEFNSEDILSFESRKVAVPFSWTDHGPRLRRQSQSCSPLDVQHVLFILDSSGSIGLDRYQRMKDALSKLVPLFCNQVKFAMVTFSRDISLEFCFDCFENTYLGREATSSAISSAEYHNRNTNTGAATKCVCDELLNHKCGITSNPSCLDVVYITDGKSNDRTHKVCKEVECLHQKYGVNTYAIGINSQTSHSSSVNQEELDCISDSSNILSAFQYNSFDDFEEAIDKIIIRLFEVIVSGNPYACLRRDEVIDPTGAP